MVTNPSVNLCETFVDLCETYPDQIPQRFAEQRWNPGFLKLVYLHGGEKGRKGIWAKARLLSALPYPNLKVGVIDNQVVNGL